MKYMKKIAFFIFALISVILFVVTIKGVGGNLKPGNYSSQVGSPFESSHERSTYSQTVSIVDKKTFQLDLNEANFSTPDVGISQGKFFSLFPPGVSLTIAPLYLLGQKLNFSQVASYATVSIFALLCLFLLYKISRNIFCLPIWTSIIVGLIFCFATPAWAYSVTIYEHIFSTFFILAAFYCAWLFRKNKGYIWGVCVWLLAGLSIFFDYPNIIIMTPILVYFLTSALDIQKITSKIRISINMTPVITGVMFLLLLFLLGFFNHTNYGKWLQPTNTLPRYDNQTSGQDATLLIQPATPAKSVLTVFSEERVISGLYLLFVAPEKGLLIFSPILILGVLILFSKQWLKNTEMNVALSIIIINILLYASFGDPGGGWAFGPRYLIPSMAFIPILIGCWLNDNPKSFIKRAIVFCFFSISSLIALAGVLTTNLLPPKTIAVYQHIKYGLAVTIDNMVNGQSSSFIYNTYLSTQMPLWEYFIIIYTALIIMVLAVLFILPKFEKHDN